VLEFKSYKNQVKEFENRWEKCIQRDSQKSKNQSSIKEFKEISNFIKK